MILNEDGSIYHLNLFPEQVSNTIITVGDPDRVREVTKYFDKIDFQIRRREFCTHTGTFKGKRISVISTGIGTDNVDIVLNELDALINIDLEKRMIRDQLKRLDFIRVGTSGAIQPDIPVDSTLVSSYAVGLDGLMHFYPAAAPETGYLIRQINENLHFPIPAYAFPANESLLNAVPASIRRGITISNTGFYGPQGRTIRLSSAIQFEKIRTFEFEDQRITNLEMETAGIYGLSSLLGHRAISFNAILANRATQTFSQQPAETIDRLIRKTLDWIIEKLP